MMGVHRSAVHQLLQQHQIAKVQSSIQHKQRVVGATRTLKPGLSLKGAAEHLGISLNMVQQHGQLVEYQLQRMPAER